MIYTVGLRTAVTTVLYSSFELSTGSTQSCKIYEIGVTNAAATATVIGLGYPTIVSNTPTYLTNGTGSANAGFQAEMNTGDPAAQTRVAIAWTTAAILANPITSPFLRRASLPGSIGAGVIWKFPKGLFLPAGASGLTSLCLFNIITSGALDVWIVIDE